MKKKFLTILSLAALFTASAFGVGCAETPDSSLDVGSSNTESSSQLPGEPETPNEPETPAEPSIQLSAATLSVEAYESATLTASLQNSEETIVWTSSNEAVAKVVDGVVTAYKAGTATITAAAGDISASCEVTVTAATETPVFAELPEELTMIKGSYEELDVTLSYKGGEFALETQITYEVEGDVVSVDEDGVLNALNYGTQSVVVKAFIGTEEVASATISVEVIEFGQLIVDLPENTLNLTVGEEGYSLSNIQAQINGAIVENAEITAESADAEVAAVQDGKIIAVGRGETTVTVYYVSESDKTYETEITVIVTKQIEETAVNFFVRGSSENLAKADTGTAVVELPATLDLTGLSKVLCGETEVAYSLEGSVLTLTNAPAGEQTYTLETPLKDYLIEGCIYTNTVSTKEEFLDWRNNAENIYAYTVLTADIDLEGELLEKATYNFARGMLDGRGHTISNFTLQTSIVPNVAATAGFRNLQLVNVVQDCTGVTGQMKFGFFSQMMYGTIENVLIVGSVANLAEDVPHWGAVCYGSNATGIVKDVVVQLNSTSKALHYICGPNGNPNVLDNVHFVYSGPSAKISAGTSENSAIYATEEALANADFSLFSNAWTVNAGVPYLSDYADILANATVTVNGEAKLGETLTFATTSFYPLTYALAEEVDGVSVVDNTVVISEEATLGAAFTVLVTNEEIGLSQEFSFEILMPFIDTGLTLLAKGDASHTEQNANTGNATLDLTDSGVDLSKVTSILCGETELSGYSIDGNKITFVNAPAGEYVYTFATPKANYTMNICVYNHEIATKADFLAWRNTNFWKYTILTADIDLENEVLGAAQASAMRGIVDGRGHKISNFTVSTGIVTSMQAAGGFKNISFVNVTQDCTGIETASIKAVRYGFITQTMHGTIENVYIQGKIINVAEGMAHWGMLAYNSGATAVIKNVVMDVESNCTQANFVINTATFKTIDNVHLNFRCTDETYDGKVQINGSQPDATNSAVYRTDAALESADFSLFTGIWTVESGKLPYID